MRPAVASSAFFAVCGAPADPLALDEQPAATSSVTVANPAIVNG
ncbi:MAG: hypothetical protein ACTHKL_12140 [Streptosporangiaceae bacterium]